MNMSLSEWNKEVSWARELAIESEKIELNVRRRKVLIFISFFLIRSSILHSITVFQIKANNIDVESILRIKTIHIISH